MISIKEALGPNWSKIELHDDDTEYGGISYHGETLDNFMAETEINENDSIGDLQRSLKGCGIKEIEDGNNYIEKIIQKKIKEIESELNIVICDYRWDYE